MSTEAKARFPGKGEGQSGKHAVKTAVNGWRGLHTYLATVILASLALVATLAAARPFASPANLWLAAAFLALICSAGVYPIQVAPKTKVNVTTAAIFAAALLFDPLAATLIAGGGVAISQLFLPKKSWYNRAFSVAQTFLFTAATALVFAALGKAVGAASLISAAGVLCAGTAAVAMYLVNSTVVALAAGLQLGKNPASIWVAGTKQAAVSELALFIIGLASAILATQAPWTLVLMAAPVVVVYHSFKRMAASNARAESHLQELKAAQAQLVESARMASIGTMAAGIAHQINNPMFIIHGRAEELYEDADEQLRTQYARRAVQAIMEMADRVSRIVNSLLPKSRVTAEGTPYTDVNEVMRNTLVLLEQKLLKSRVEVSLALAEGLPTCRGESCEIQEMLINLVDNACNAMPQGGKLSLTTRTTRASVIIRVADTGVGILPENLSRIFSPFFTTRKETGGVGLGLYMSKHIAEKYGGSIAVESQVGAGTVFTISLQSDEVKRDRVRLERLQDWLAASGTGSRHREL